MAISKYFVPALLSLLVLVLILPTSGHAFGAGNIASISKIEGQNWRHGDIEDTLVNILMARVAGGKKFSKLNVQRVYFGNWLRDYSQAVDVATVKHVPTEAIRIILWVLGFLSFGYGTKEFEVTRDRLGCYRPEEHIDNPKDYADNVDARQFDPRLRGPVNEQVELAVDHRTGLKMYIAAEDQGITTSAGLIRDLLGRCIHLGRQYAMSKNKQDLYEALRLLGTGCHCLEDFSAHSNYIELALRNCGEEQVFPHVGSNAYIQLDGVDHGVWPITTGTFGGVDFLHSVMGEFSDKMTQSELQQLEGTVQSTQSQGSSKLVKELISQMPSGVFGGKNLAAEADELEANATAARMRDLNVTSRDPAAMMQQLGDISRQIYPIMEFHDELFQGINSAIEKIPILPGLIEKFQEAINVYVFSLIAPLVLPIISQVKDELNLGSSEVIQKSKEKQMIVFHDDNATDPTHSMLSKDHFSNVLNEPAGKVASQVLKWVVPQIMACWDDERLDVNRTLNRIIKGVFHHPALRHVGEDGASDCRQLMFKVVEKWWREKSEQERQILRDQLSRDGVEHGRNHKSGVQDSGHGGCQALHIPQTQVNSNLVDSTATNGVYGTVGSPMPSGGSLPSKFQRFGDLAGGGLVGGLIGGVGSKLLGKTFGKKQDDMQNFQQQNQYADGSYNTTYMETGHRPSGYGEPEKYGQAEFQHTTYPSGGYKSDFKRYEQYGPGGTQGYGFQQTEEVKPSYTGGYDHATEQRYEQPGGQWESQTQQEYVNPSGQHEIKKTKRHGKKHEGEDSDSDSESGPSSDDNPYEDPDKKERKRMKKERKKRERKDKMQHGQEQRHDLNDHGGPSNAYPCPESPHLNPLTSGGFYGSHPLTHAPEAVDSYGVPYAATMDTPGGYGGGPNYSGGALPPPPPSQPLGWADGFPQGQLDQNGASWYGQPQQPTGYGQQLPANFTSGGYGVTSYGNATHGVYEQQVPPQGFPQGMALGGHGGAQGYGYGGAGPGSSQGGQPSQGGFPGAHGHGADEHGGFPGAHGHGAQGYSNGNGNGQGGRWY